MFNARRASKIKNDKILTWRIELAGYSFDIHYRLGEKNVPAESLTRLFCSSVTSDKLMDLHNSLCHPGVTRMAHYLKMKNIAAYVEGVKAMATSCKIFAKCKPLDSNLVKTIQPFERLSIDFKGALPSVTQNKFIVTVVDEYSRFPFAIPCTDVSTLTVIKC